MDKELIIKLGLDPSGASASSATFHAEEKARIQELVNTSKAADKTIQASAEGVSKQRVQAALQASQTEQKAIQATSEVHTKAMGRVRDELGRFVKQSEDASKANVSGWDAVSQSFMAAAKSVGSMSLSMAGLNSAQAIVGTIEASFRRVNQEVLDATKHMTDYRATLLELAALKGQPGNTTTSLREELAFRAQTLQTSNDARAFQLAALGAGESAIGINISEDEMKNAQVLAGKFQAVENGSADTHGRLIGMIPSLMGGRGITGEQAFAKEQQLFRIFQPGGASFSAMTNQFLQQAPLVTSGLFQDPAQMAALLSAFSTTNSEGAGTNVQQFTRATVGGLGRMKGAQIEGLVEKQGEYLSGLGATNQMTPIGIGKLISADFSRQEAAASQEGLQFNAMDYLKTHGYANQEDIMSLLAFHGLMKSGQFEGTFERLSGSVPTVSEALSPIEARMSIDPVFAQRRADATGELAQVSASLTPTGQLSPLMESTFNRLKAQGEVNGQFDQVMNPGWFDLNETFFHPKEKTQLEAQRMLLAEGQRVGIDPSEEYMSTAVMQSGGMYVGDEKLAGLYQQVRRKGGDVQQQNFDTAKEIADRQLKAVESLERSAEAFRKASEPKNTPLSARPSVQTR